MNAENFVYWLQGFLEVSGAEELNNHQLRIVRDHIKLVLDKRTPEYNKIGEYPALPIRGWNAEEKATYTHSCDETGLGIVNDLNVTNPFLDIKPFITC